MKWLPRLLFLLCSTQFSIAYAANLIEVYNQAQVSDPIFLQAISQRMSTKEGVPISLSALLPNISLQDSPGITRFSYTGTYYQSVTGTSAATVNPRNLTQRSNNVNLMITQTIFDFSQFSTVSQQVALSKGADATLNAALQDLMIRVSNAYFAILRDEDMVGYASASKNAYAHQLDQIRQQYQVGLKTVTDLYTAQASYDSATATLIANQTTLQNDKENLRVITGIYYDHLAPLSERFPLVRPMPTDINAWTAKAQRYNWSIKATAYQMCAAKRNIMIQQSGHLPTLSAEASFQKQYTYVMTDYDAFDGRRGAGTISERSLSLNLNVPIYEGGGVVANTNKAVYDYQTSEQQWEQTVRNTLNTVRQSYLGVIAGISKIDADKAAIKSATSSLHGLEESYKVGTETLVDVLNQQQTVFKNQTAYATDRYAFINNMLALKQAAGTLSFTDLRAINRWLR